MDGCHVIIFISQNPNPNFLLSFHHHGSRRRTSSPRRPPLHHQSAVTRIQPAHHGATTSLPHSSPESAPFSQRTRTTTAPPSSPHLHFTSKSDHHDSATPSSRATAAEETSTISCRSTATPPQIARFSPQFRHHCTSLEATFRFTTTVHLLPSRIAAPSTPPWTRTNHGSHHFCTSSEHRPRAPAASTNLHHNAFVVGEGGAAAPSSTSLHETLNAANPSLERESALCATCQHLIGQSNWSTGQLWSTGQSQQSTLVKTANMVKWEGQNWKLDRN